MDPIRYFRYTALLLVATLAIGSLPANPDSPSELLTKGLMAEEVRLDPAAPRHCSPSGESVTSSSKDHETFIVNSV